MTEEQENRTNRIHQLTLGLLLGMAAACFVAAMALALAAPSAASWA